MRRFFPGQQIQSIAKGAIAVLAWTSLSFAGLAQAYDPAKAPSRPSNEVPAEIEGVGIEEHLGARIDTTLPFVNDKGEQVTMGDFLSGQKPVLLSIVYFNCPSLCNFHLNGVTEALSKLDWTVGDEFELVALTMNHREGPELAAQKKTSYVNDYGRPESADGWHFLTGTEENIRKLSDQVGFNFKWMDGSQEYAHASAAIILTPTGKVSRYLHGIEFDPKNLRLALLEASDGKIGDLVDQLALFCFQFDPTKKKYTLYAFNIMRIGAILMVLVLAVFLVPMWLRERQRRKPLKGES